MRKATATYISLFLLSITFLSCNNNSSYIEKESPKHGSINISVDESFKPVIEEQIKMYQTAFPGTIINASYKPEVECFKDLQSDSTRLIIVARGLNKNESDYYKSKLQYKPQWALVAFDAVAVIMNAKGTDSVFTMKKLKNILSGETNVTAVMDGKNATSTVRYLKDSILVGGTFGKNVVAAKSNEDVVDAVSKQKDAIGFVGLNWVGDTYNKKQQATLSNIKLALVECVQCPEKGYFAKPSQASISYAQYPLARPLYYIVKENATGLGTGFINFLSQERGQLIFKRAFLVPAIMNFTKRKSNIQDAD